MLGGVDMDGIVQTIIDEGIKVVETAGRRIPPEMMRKFKSNGVVVMHKCTSIRHALSAQKNGEPADSAVSSWRERRHPLQREFGL